MPCAYFGGKEQRDEGEEGKGRIIIPKDKFKEFVEFQKMLPVEKIEKLLYPFMPNNIRQASYLSTGYSDLNMSEKHKTYLSDIIIIKVKKYG